MNNFCALIDLLLGVPQLIMNQIFGASAPDLSAPFDAIFGCGVV